MFKKKYALIFILLVSIAVLAACGGKDGKGSTNGTSSFNSDEPAEVIFYSNNNDPVESFDYRFGDAIRKKFPHYTITYLDSNPAGRKLADMVTTGERFDIFFQSIGNYEGHAFPFGIEYDMTDLIKEHNVDLNRIEKTVVDAVQQASGGKLFGLPIFTSNLVLYYNKTLFDRFGEDYPKDGMTWEDLNELSRKMTRIESGQQYFGFTHSSQHTLRLDPLSIPHTDLEADKPTINSDERWKRFFQTFYVDPFRVPGSLDGLKSINRLPTINHFVADQNVATFAYLSSLVYVWEDQLKQIDFDIAALPTFSDMPSIGSQSYPSYFGITKMAENKDAAMQVLKYMVSDEFQTGLARKGIMPVLANDEVKKELGKDSYFSDKINWGAIFHNDFAPIPPKAIYDIEMVRIYDVFGVHIALDRQDINTALRNAEEQAVSKIEEIKNQ